MGRVAVIGERTQVDGYALAGAVVLGAETDEEVGSAWDNLPGDVDVVILTARAARCLGSRRGGRLLPLTVVMPP
jgi:vacuolar-type H+-ATPase subunit F/Vma7